MDPLLFLFHVCHAVLSVPCSLVVTCWERADLLALLYMMFSCAFVTFQYGVLGRVWYLIVLIPDLCLPLYHSLTITKKQQQQQQKTTTYRLAFGIRFRL